MKKIIFLLIAVLALFACNKSKKVNEKITTSESKK